MVVDWTELPMRRSRQIMRLSLFICTVTVGATLACESVASIKSKEEYGVLQSVEFEHRSVSFPDRVTPKGRLLRFRSGHAEVEVQ